MVSALTVEGVGLKNLDIMRGVRTPLRPLLSSEVRAIDGGATIRVNIDPSVRTATVAVLVKPEASLVGTKLPRFAFKLDGKPVNTTGEEGKGDWEWYLTTTGGGNHNLELTLPDGINWKGSVSAWVLSSQIVKGKDIVCTISKAVRLPPMPPRPWPAGEVHRTLPIGECVVERR